MQKFDKIIGENDKILLKQNYIKAMENNDFKILVNHFKIKEELASKYTYMLLDCCNDIKNCKDCPGLSSCKNEVKGHCMMPIVNERVINFSYNICKYSLEQKFRENITLFDVPSSIKNASIKEIYVNDKNRIEIIKAIKKFITDYNNNINPKGIYLHGNFGCGKTYLIAALFNELAKKNNRSVIIHVPELLRTLKDSFSTNYTEKFDTLKKTPLLLLDDIGAEHLTAWGRDEVIEPILQYRMDENLPTFFTSNFTIEELETHFSISTNSIDKVKAKRIIERIKQLSNDIELISKNLRN